MFREYYLDTNAHLPLSSKALEAGIVFSKNSAAHGHPSSPSKPGRLAAGELEKARAKIAKLIGAEKPAQIVFTSGCTQAAEWGLDIFFRHQEQLPPVCNPIEHPAVREVYETLHQEIFNSNSCYLPINKDSSLVQPLESYNKVCCMLMHNETGVIYPVSKMETDYIFCDASQALGKIPVNVTELGIDIAVFSAHKFGGPGGFGFMYLKNTSDWEAFGAGSRYFLDRTGTPDVMGAVTTAAALEDAICTLPQRTENMIVFQSVLENGLESMGFEIIGKQTARSPNTTFVRMPDLGLKIMFDLADDGIHVGLGSACGSMHSGESYTMKICGASGSTHDFLRISTFGEYTSKDAEYVLGKIRCKLKAG